jgi:hypothetical protein
MRSSKVGLANKFRNCVSFFFLYCIIGSDFVAIKKTSHKFPETPPVNRWGLGGLPNCLQSIEYCRNSTASSFYAVS